MSSPPLSILKQAHRFVSDELAADGGVLCLSLRGALIFRDSVILREIRINLTFPLALPSPPLYLDLSAPYPMPLCSVMPSLYRAQATNYIHLIYYGSC